MKSNFLRLANHGVQHAMHGTICSSFSCRGEKLASYGTTQAVHFLTEAVM